MLYETITFLIKLIAINEKIVVLFSLNCERYYIVEKNCSFFQNTEPITMKKQYGSHL